VGFYPFTQVFGDQSVWDMVGLRGIAQVGGQCGLAGALAA